MFLVDNYGYLTAIARLGLSSRPDYVERNLIEGGFTPLKSELTAFTVRGLEVSELSASVFYNSHNTIASNDHINRSMDRCRAIGCVTSCKRYYRLCPKQYMSH